MIQKIKKLFKKEIRATTTEYIALDRKDRELFGFYVYPKWLEIESVKDLFGEKCSYRRLDQFLKKEYPIQYFFRGFVCGGLQSFIWRFNHRWYKYISCNINPRQKWLTKKIPKTWCDKDHLMSIVLQECIINYVEKEECYDFSAWDDERKDIVDKIKQCYQFFKYDYELLEKQLNDMWDRDADINEINKFEQFMDDEETKYLQQIIEIRKYLWT